MNRVTGIGGIFFKSENPEQLHAWYEKHLGIRREPHRHGAASYGCHLPVPNGTEAAAKALTGWMSIRTATTTIPTLRLDRRSRRKPYRTLGAAKRK